MTSLMTQGVLSGIMSAPGLVGSTLFGADSDESNNNTNGNGNGGSMNKNELLV